MSFHYFAQFEEGICSKRNEVRRAGKWNFLSKNLMPLLTLTAALFYFLSFSFIFSPFFHFNLQFYSFFFFCYTKNFRRYVPRGLTSLAFHRLFRSNQSCENWKVKFCQGFSRNRNRLIYFFPPSIFKFGLIVFLFEQSRKSCKFSELISLKTTVVLAIYMYYGN